MCRLTPLFSGSSGNCTLIECAGTSLLVDAGVSCKKIENSLQGIGKSMHDIAGILITHEHNDHIMSVGSLSRKYKIPVYASYGTWEAMCNTIGKVHAIRAIKPATAFSVGNIEIGAFLLPHDAAEPVGYNFFAEDKKLTIATDLGEMNEAVFLSLTGSDSILLEANYDKDMLENGKYPYVLKNRIAGKKGHLSNAEAATVAARLVCLGTKQIILGHLSRENNKPELAYDVVQNELKKCGICVEKDVCLTVANRA